MADYEDALDDLHDFGVDVIAASVDSRDEARATVEKLELDFPVGWGVDGEDVVARFGGYRHPDGYLQPINVLLHHGEVEQVTYSSGPLGRLQPDEVLQWVEFREAQEDTEDQDRAED